MDTAAFFDALWTDFTRVAPAAATLRRALEDVGERVRNDHVAFRTLDRGPIALDRLERPILDLGYVHLDAYRFEDKHLRARAYVHGGEADAPKVFLSELLTDELTPGARDILDRLAAEVPADVVRGPEVFWSGRPWSPPSIADYRRLQEESEYASWLLALGLRANHFTVLVNELSAPLRSIEAILAFVESRGFRVNESGGRVKGSPAVLLEQGATLADRVQVRFAEGDHVVPTCFYEFALRHVQPDGTLYRGFVAANADRIFESTFEGTGRDPESHG